MNNTLDEKENELNNQFDKEQAEATQIEEQIKVLQAKHQEKVINMTKLQGAFALLQELKVDENIKVEPKKK